MKGHTLSRGDNNKGVKMHKLTTLKNLPFPCSRITGQISTKLGTKHFKFVEMKDQVPFQGDIVVPFIHLLV